MQDFINFLQSNFGVAIGSIITIGVMVIAVIAKTKIGASSLKKLTATIAELQTAYNQKVGEVRELKATTLKQLQEYKKEADYYKEIILEICDTIPNKKVQAIGQKVRQYTADEYLQSKINEIDEYIVVKLDEINVYKEQLETYYNGLKDKAKIKEMDLYNELETKINGLIVYITDYQTMLKTATTEEIEAFKVKYEEWLKLFEEIVAKINEFKGE